MTKNKFSKIMIGLGIFSFFLVSLYVGITNNPQFGIRFIMPNFIWIMGWFIYLHSSD